MTVCRLQRNNPEERVVALREGNRPIRQKQQTDEAEFAPRDLEQVSAEQICKRIEQHLQGHAMARLVAALLQVPHITVQVKSGDAAMGKPEIDQRRGAMTRRAKANLGLFVSWAGFKGSVKKTASTFFEIRLWDVDALVNVLLQN